MRTTIYVTARDREVIDTFPRGVSMSAIFRCLLHAGLTNDEEWKRLLEREPDIRKAAAAIKEKLKSVGKRSIVF